MTKGIVGLDIGSGFVKAVDGQKRVIFPSIYAFRHGSIWENDELVEGVGEEALEIAKHPNSIRFYPVVDGKPQHQAWTKLAEEALKRLKINSPIHLVTGVPFDTARDDRDRIKEDLKQKLSLEEIAIYPQALGTLFDLDIDSSTIINIGHGTCEILAIENLKILSGTSGSLANDFLISSLTTYVQSKFGFKPTLEAACNFIINNTAGISAPNQTVSRKELQVPLETVTNQLVEKVCYDTRFLLSQLPSNLECIRHIVLSGGGALVRGVREGVQKTLSCKILVPPDPIFSNVNGFYKMGVKLFGE